MKYAIRNDDSDKDKLAKINACFYQLNRCSERFIKEALNNKERNGYISVIEARRNNAGRNLCKYFILNK